MLRDFAKMAQDYTQASEAGRVLRAESWNDFDTNSRAEQEASAKAFAKMDFCGGAYVGYFVATAPWYNFAFLVFDAETHRRIYYDLQIHHSHAETVAESIAEMARTAQNKLFTVASVCAEPVKNHDEYSRKAEFVRDIYADRYARLYMGYIGKPSAAQVQASREWFADWTSLYYYANKEEAFSVHEILQKLEERRREHLDDFEYWKDAFKTEFYNFECMYSERYEEAAASAGADVENLTDAQRKAYAAAYKDFWREVRDL